MLTAVVGTLYQRVQPNSEGELFAPSLKKTSSMTIELLTEAILSKEEMIKSITNSVLSTIVTRVVYESEERNDAVFSSLSEVIDVFLDSKKENRERSLQDKLVIDSVVSEMVDGITEVLAQPPSERIRVSDDDPDAEAIKDATSVCELAILAMNHIIMVRVGATA